MTITVSVCHLLLRVDKTERPPLCQCHVTCQTRWPTDDHDFNVLSVSLIQKHRCFLEFSCAERSNNNIQKNAQIQEKL
jgi:hypothetical protein